MGAAARSRSYELKRRCCQVNLYDDIGLPEGLAPGPAHVTLSLDAWSQGDVAPSTHTVEILPAPPGPKLLPVSARLKSKLEHPHPDGGIVNIKITPDGRQLLVLEETPAEFSDSRPRTMSLLDVATDEYRQLLEGHAWVSLVHEDNHLCCEAANRRRFGSRLGTLRPFRRHSRCTRLWFTRHRSR